MAMDQHSEHPRILVLGVGNILFSDEGVGIRVIEAIQERYSFPPHVTIKDGGTLGVHLLGTISHVDYLIVVDVIRNEGQPGSLYRLTGEEIPRRIFAKNSLHDVDFLEALTLCEAIDGVPETVIVGVEPVDIEAVSIALTPLVQEKVDPLIQMVLAELDTLGVRPEPTAERIR